MIPHACLRAYSHEVLEVSSIQPHGQVLSWKAEVSEVRWRALVRVMPQQGQSEVFKLSGTSQCSLQRVSEVQGRDTSLKSRNQHKRQLKK